VCAVLVFLWLNASIPPWHGGWAAGPRYLVPMLPFASLLAGGVLASPAAHHANERWRRVRAAAIVSIAALGLVSVANMFAATAVKPEIPTDVPRPYGEFIWPKFLAGDLAISTQSIDAIGNPEHAPRQAWNLGMQAGLGGHASLVPLYIWIAVVLAWTGWLVKRDVRPTALAS
jgi:hypothetical protein